MPKFGTKSKNALHTCDNRLKKVFNEVIKTVDCSVLEGYRNKIDQNKAYEKGASTVKYPFGRHNKRPSLAVDVVRYPVDWDDLERSTLFAGYVLGVASQMGINLRWGNDWDCDFETKDTGLKDYPHFEIREDD